MIIFAVVFSLFECFLIQFGIVLTTNGTNGSGLTSLIIWPAVLFGPAVYLFAFDRKRGSYVNLIVIALFLAAAVGGLSSGRLDSIPYYHQILAMGAIVAILAIAAFNSPGLSLAIKKRLLIGLLAWGPLLGISIWSMLLSGPIVAFYADRTAGGQPYCILKYSEHSFRQYKQSSSIWDFQASTMISPYVSTGGSSEFQWEFHALLVTPRDLFNWSYQGQRFEKVTDTAHRNLGIGNLSCKP